MYADEAWVTLATNDTYCLGALVLAHSLRKVNTTRTLHCMVTPNVSNDMRTNLSYVFDHITEVNLMDSRDASKLAMIQRPDLGVTFTKLHCWKLEQYKKCVFVDADCLVLQKCDEIFEYPEFSAAPDIGWPDIFNSGVFVFVPSVDTFKKLVELAIKEGSFDGGDQGLLNVFFSDWLSRGPSHRLPFIYNAAASAVYTYIAALKRFGKDVKIVHFIGANKPWTLLSSDVLAQAAVSPDNPEAGFLHYWFGIFGERVLTSLNPDFFQHQQASTGETGLYQLQVRHKFPYLPSAVSVSDEDHQKAWEEGVVDYTGRDSWDNIQKKLDQTLTMDSEKPSK